MGVGGWRESGSFWWEDRVHGQFYECVRLQKLLKLSTRPGLMMSRNEIISGKGNEPSEIRKGREERTSWVSFF